jgi:primosomal protein N' (replication factor Y)
MTEEQIPLLPGAAVRRPRMRPTATDLPVARVALLTPVPHLDRPFDYEVPEELSEAAQPGVRVRVRLAGRLVDGFVLERVATSERVLQPLGSVHGPPVLTPDMAALCREVADRYAGTLADVLRFAIPPRHARVEKGMHLDRTGHGATQGQGAGEASAALGVPGMGLPEVGLPGAGPHEAAWARYRGGAELLAGIGGSTAVRALWVAGPAEPWEQRIAELVAATLARGRGALVLVPDATDVQRVYDVLARQPGLPRPVRLLAESGPEARYRAYLKILIGSARVVVGTRAAVFAPVVDLGVIVVWDDADESLAEPQAPGWHAREVAALRSAAQEVSLVLAGPSVSLEAARMAASGWLVAVELPRAVLRSTMPRVQVAADVTHGDPARATDRIPSAALEVLRAGLAVGPVLVSVPRAGYLPGVACQSCREQARCPQCTTLMRADGPDRRPTCSIHGPVVDWHCPVCGCRELRATTVGVRRTAEEFGRALPGFTVVTSSGSTAVRTLPRPRSLAVATPGAEPDPGPEGYAALVLLDVAAALSRPGLRVAEEVLRRWFLAAALVRPAATGGRVLIVGQPDVREVQALVRWDPHGYAQRELAERRALHLPPAVRVAQLTGPALATAEVVEEVGRELGEKLVRRSGPLPGPETLAGAASPGGPEVTWLLAVSLADGAGLSAVIRRVQSQRSARRAPQVRARLDPVRLR